MPLLHTGLYAWVLGIIMLVLLAVSLSRLRGARTKDDYLVAGRSLSAFVLVFTLLSSWIGAGSLFAGAENAYINGFAALWGPAGGWAGLLLIYFVAPRARKFAQFTIPDLLEARYNQTARVLGVIAILFAYTGIASYQLRGGGDILHLLFPTVISSLTGMYIIAGFVIAFTALAGMASVAYMDVVIGLLATVVLIVSLPILMNHVGGWAGMRAALPATHFEALGSISFARAMEFFLPTMLLMMGNQAMYQKFFSARSGRDARIAVVGWIVGTVILETIIVAIAVVGSALFHTGEVSHRPREIIAYTARHGLPAALGALLLGAIFAKVVSTANNYLFSPATNLVNDIFLRYLRPGASDKNILLVSRIVVVLLGIWALVQGAYTQSILEKSLYAYTVYSAALTPVILAAFYSRRINSKGAVSCIAAGTFVTVFWDKDFVRRHLPAALAHRDAIFPALIASLICLFLVSWLTSPPEREKVAVFLPDQADRSVKRDSVADRQRNPLS
jgi:SSS family solute:Na+ symporter/sodium/proline symporter